MLDTDKHMHTQANTSTHSTHPLHTYRHAHTHTHTDTTHTHDKDFVVFSEGLPYSWFHLTWGQSHLHEQEALHREQTAEAAHLPTAGRGGTGGSQLPARGGVRVTMQYVWIGICIRTLLSHRQNYVWDQHNRANQMLRWHNCSTFARGHMPFSPIQKSYPPPSDRN